MKTKSGFLIMLALALALPVALIMGCRAIRGRATLQRPQGPCDIYAADGDPCVAAHSTTRALFARYNGPLYQVMRQSDGKTLDIGVVQPSAHDAGGYANAAAQDKFCADTYCWITKIYDQSGHGNDLSQAPRGGFSGPAMGGFNNVPIADMAPVTMMGHKVYGVFIEPGMGLRQDDAHGTAVDDQAQGQYWIVNGHHYNSGCCFDYGNAETDSRDDGNGTMETTYYGSAGAWYHGPPPGPWIMTDQENNLVGCVNPDGSKGCPDLPIITWRFVTAMAKGEPHHWTSMGGDAQAGDLKVMFSGPRVNKSYDPMRKQGAILLGNGGDNSNGSQGTFYEGAMTAAGAFPSDATDQKIQANIVAAGYDLSPVSIAPATETDKPPGLQTFSPGSSQDVTVTFRNTTGNPATEVELSIAVPGGWTSTVSGGSEKSKTFSGPIPPGGTVSATFKITSGRATFNGDLVAKATWSANDVTRTETMAEKVRNVIPIKINEFDIGSGSPANSADAFVELYNAGDSDVDISGWTLTEHPTQEPVFSLVKVPRGTRLAAKSFYVFGLSDSGLAVPAQKGDTVIHVRNTSGMSVGDTIEIGTGSSVETRKIASLGTAAGNDTTVWQPLPDGPVITIPAGSTNIPFTAGRGFGGGPSGFRPEVGQKIGIGYGATYPTVANSIEKFEVVTVTAVGRPGTQGYLASDAKAGDTKIRARNAGNISVGDKIRLDIDSVGHGVETVTVTRINRVEGRGGVLELDLAAPLKFNHSDNIPFSDRGTGISFKPATAFAHSSNEPILPLGTGITLDQPLASNHSIHAVVRDTSVATADSQENLALNQWFGGPVFSPSAGNIVLRDADGLVVDSLNYGGLVDPWAAEGYQAESGSGKEGNFVPAPNAERGFGRFGFRRGGAAAAEPVRSAGRFPDGADTDDNQHDFLLQTETALASESPADANNIKVVSVADFHAGQKIIIDAGADREIAVVATVGTAGGTTINTATDAGATVIPVANPFGFNPGQTITVDSGANQETAVVASVERGRFRRGQRLSGASIKVSAPLKNSHAEGAEVSGSGITLSAALTRAHERGTPIVSSVPTPGAPNRYARK
ncbi:MAG TPA: arabinofuranosidase catalytic domain-containing protein [Verrucomicrobiae bacterium]|nr:arabinofuranosidase catalytic domain-containing protein [Verrucomicrobiae bacterium]